MSGTYTPPPAPAPPIGCGSCRFHDVDGEGQGYCRRHPPMAYLERYVDNLDHERSQVVSVWPEVGDRDWCGEYERKP